MIEENRINVDITAGSVGITASRPLLSNMEVQQLDLMLKRYANRHPNSDFCEMSVREKDLWMGFAEFYGFTRMMWVLTEVSLRPGVPTTGTVTEALDRHLQREKEAINSLELEREDAIVDLICNALDGGKFSNMDEFFKGRETWDNPRIRNRVWRALLL